LSKRWFAFNIGILFSNIMNVLQPSGFSNPTQRIFGADIQFRAELAMVRVFLRRIVHCRNAKIVPVVQQEICEGSATDGGDILEHRLEYGLKVAKRPADNLKHFRRCAAAPMPRAVR
jgi:hypothetical protein